MALPKIQAPTFECVQPSTGNSIQYRPFLVKEEKILLIAKESGERTEIFNAIKQIVNNCVVTEGFDADEIPIFDMEYLFLMIRSVSVGNKVAFKVEDSDDQITYDLELDLNDVKVEFPEGHEDKVMIDENVGIVLKHPTPKIAEKLEEAETVADIIYETIMNCVHCAFDEERVYDWKTSTEEEKVEFLDMLPVQTYNKIQKFFETSPKIEHVVNYVNSQGKEKKVVFRNLDDFFMLY